MLNDLPKIPGNDLSVYEAHVGVLGVFKSVTCIACPPLPRQFTAQLRHTQFVLVTIRAQRTCRRAGQQYASLTTGCRLVTSRTSATS